MVEESKVEEATEQVAKEVEVKEETPAEEETPEPPSEAEPQEEEKPPEFPPEEEPKRKPAGPRLTKVDRGESFWTPKELASKLACTQSYIYLMIKQGKIKFIKQGNLVKISPGEVQRILTEGWPLPPKPEPKVEAEEIVVEDPRITEKLKPPTEPTEKPEPTKNKPGWPLSIFFK